MADMSVERLAAQVSAVLAKMALARDHMTAAAAFTDDAKQATEAVLGGTRDWEAARTPAMFASAGEEMARAYAVVQAVEAAIAAYLAHIGASGPGSSAATPTPATSQAQTTPIVPPERIEQLRSDLPPDIPPLDERPRGTPTPKTHGRWIAQDGRTHREISGRDEKYLPVVEFFKSRNWKIPTRASDVEMKLAAHMRNNGIKSATLVINYVPCEGAMGCDTLVPVILPKGYTLTVYGTRGFVRVYEGGKDL
jgi:hypothetical protein